MSAKKTFFRLGLSAGSVGLPGVKKYASAGGMKGVLGLALMATLALAFLFGASIPPVHAVAFGIDSNAGATATTQGACAVSCFVTLSTSNTGDVIYLIYGSTVAPSTNPPTISDGNGLTWTLRTSVHTAGNYLFSWYAIAPTTLSSDIITVAAAATLTTNTIFAFAISGANTVTPFDSGGPTTATSAATTPPGYSLAITTTNANDMIIGVIGGLDTAYSVTAPNTQVDAFNYATADASAVSYDIVGTTGTYHVMFGGSAGGAASELIADAVQAAGAVTVPEFPTGLLVLAVPVLAIYLFMRGKGVSLGTRTRLTDAWAQTMLQLASSR